MMKKQKSNAFGKDCFLLGLDKDGDFIWLEAASWDCDWYWGFGYIEVYTNQRNPAASRDINSHSHWSGLLGKQGGEYLHHLNQALSDSVLTDSEAWKLSDLMKSFYTLKDTAEVLARGGSNLTTTDNQEAIKDTAMAERINTVLLPALFQEVYKILTPSKEG